MKTTSTLLSAIFISLAAFSAPVQSKLSITVVGNKNVEIIVNNTRYQSEDNSILVSNLEPGSHVIKVYSFRKNQRRNVWGRKAELIYSSTVYVRPGYFVGITIDHNGRATFNERSIAYNGRNDDWKNDRYDRNDRHDHYDRDDRNRHDRYDRNDYNRPLSDNSFSSIVQTLRKEYSDNSRLALARQIIERNYFTTDQVKHVMQLFSFENYRLEIAKFAYRNTSDQRNYFRVYDMLSYSSSKEQLADYIRHAN